MTDAIGGMNVSGLAPFETRYIPTTRLDQVAAQMEMAQTLSPQQFAVFNAYLNGTVGAIDQTRFAPVGGPVATMFCGAMDPTQMMFVGQMMQQQQQSMMLAILMFQQMQMMQMLMQMMMSSGFGGIDPRLLQMLMSGVQDPAWPPLPEQPPPSEVYQDRYEDEIEQAGKAAASIDRRRMAELSRIEEELYATIVGEGPETLSPSEKIEDLRDADAAYREFESRLHPALAKAQKDGRLKSIHERHHAEHTLKAKFCAAVADRLRRAEKSRAGDGPCQRGESDGHAVEA